MNAFQNSNDPIGFARDQLGFEPRADQEALLGAKDRYVILNCHRQWGKSTVTAVRAVHRAVTYRRQTIVIISRALRQSELLANRCREFAGRLGLKLRTDGSNPRSVVFPNGSVILPLPAHPSTVRGYSADLLIIDEAAHVPDEVYAAATPMLAVTQGDLWLLSTPTGRSGFFYQEWTTKKGHPWLKIEGPASESTAPIGEAFLDAERGRKTAEQFAEEYDCTFLTPGRNVFPDEWLDRCFTATIPMFDLNSRADLRFAKHRPAYYLALDVGKLRDHAAFVLLEYRVIPTGTRDPATYQALYRCELRVVMIEQFRLHTDYTEILARLRRLCEHPHLAYNTQLLFDGTGKGEPVEEMFRKAKLPVTLRPICITPGGKVTVSGSWYYVPKSHLVSSLEVLLEGGYVKIASQLPHSDLLRDELRQFERRTTPAGGTTWGAGSGHDDLAMALSLAGWWAWRHRKDTLSGSEPRTLD